MGRQPTVEMSTKSPNNYDEESAHDKARLLDKDERRASLQGSPKTLSPTKDSFLKKATHLGLCCLGLQGSYLTWGFVQEIIMTKTYEGEKFPSSTFIVFSNRLLALLVALFIVYGPFGASPTPRPHAPFWKFMPCSISNVLSSWAQYECLKYISFPLQVVSKSCKVIPVMLVGKVIHKKSYPWIDYLEAVGITVGVSMFSLSESGGDDEGKETQMIGLLLVAMYLTCDSFTSQWQDSIFRDHRIDQYQMMVGINVFSILFTTLALLKSGELFSSIEFVSSHPVALQHLAILSATSATGQLFIFYTIKSYGPVIFTIIMTCRQMLSMVISCLWFGHTLGELSTLGALVVFGTLGYRIYRKFDSRGGKR